ncbi:MAG: hypothetical protein VCD00_15275 [Candidatus Hydrogenedentota bacterium]
MNKVIIPVLAFGMIVTAMVVGASPAHARGQGNPNMSLVVYVSGQGLFYDSQITTDLPFHGEFQKIEMGGPHGGPMTEYGPGDAGYLGGRWWADMNGNGVQDADDHYFSCPLLGPGREEA